MRALSLAGIFVALASIGCGQAAPTAPSTASSASPANANQNAPATEIFSGSCKTAAGSGECQLTHLGRTTVAVDRVVQSGPPFGVVTYTTSNGDRLIMVGDGNLSGVPGPDPGLVTLSGTVRIVGGTGRFTNAWGTIGVSGTASLTGNTTAYTLDGAICYVAAQPWNGD